MRFKIKKEWEKWFAWYPVRVDEEYAWLEYVERKEKEFQNIYDLLFHSMYYYRNF